jgi:hypothetical protein
VFLDWDTQGAAERRLVAEQTRVQEFKQRPHFAKIVLDRRAGQGKATPGVICSYPE